MGQMEPGAEKAAARKRCKNQQGGLNDSGTRQLELKLSCRSPDEDGTDGADGAGC